MYYQKGPQAALDTAYKPVVLDDLLREKALRMNSEQLKKIKAAREEAGTQRIQTAARPGELISFARRYAAFAGTNAEAIPGVTEVMVLLEYEPPFRYSELGELKATAWLTSGTAEPPLKLEGSKIYGDPTIGREKSAEPIRWIAGTVAEGMEEGIVGYTLINQSEKEDKGEMAGLKENGLEDVTSAQSFYLRFLKRRKQSPQG